MKKDLLVVVSWALVTMVVTLGVLWPYRVAAVGPEESRSHLIAEAPLKTDGCEISIHGIQASYEAGEAVNVEIKAINTGNTQASLNLSLQLMMTPPGAAMSRIGPRPREVWKSECPLAVAAQQSASVTLKPDVKLQAGSMGYFVLKAGPASITGGRFAVQPTAVIPIAGKLPAKG